MGYFYWLCVKNSNRLTEISLGYLKDTKVYLESKASFIHIGSIASFKPFFYCLVVGVLHFFEGCPIHPHCNRPLKAYSVRSIRTDR